MQSCVWSLHIGAEQASFFIYNDMFLCPLRIWLVVQLQKWDGGVLAAFSSKRYHYIIEENRPVELLLCDGKLLPPVDAHTVYIACMLCWHHNPVEGRQKSAFAAKPTFLLRSREAGTNSAST